MSQQRREHGARRSVARVGALVLLVVGLVSTVIVSQAWSSAVATREARDLELTASAAQATVVSNIARSTDVLNHLRALVTANPDLTNGELARYWTAARMPQEFPGVLGFVRVDRVAGADVEEFLSAAAADPINGLPFSDKIELFPPGQRDEYCLQRVGLFGLRQVENFEIPPGLDFCAEVLAGDIPSVLPPALEAATSTGELVTLRFDPLEALVVVVLPLYEGDELPATLDGRENAVVGWVVSTLDPNALASEARDPSALAIEVHHRDALGDDLIVAQGDADAAVSGAITTTEATEGWTIEVTARPSTGGLSADHQGLIVLAVGVLLAVGGAAYIWLLSGARDRALALVAERTDQLAHQALHDHLTGLPNRALIRDRAKRTLAHAERDDWQIAAMFVDLDDFKSINDTLGHGAGDELLVAVAERFEGALRSSDTVGRLGGDEFVILLEGDSLAEGPEVVAQRLLDVLREPFELAGEKRYISASVGIAAGSREDVDEWLRDADIALYKAKASGKNRYAVFNPAMQRELRARLEEEQERRNLPLATRPATAT